MKDKDFILVSIEQYTEIKEMTTIRWQVKNEWPVMFCKKIIKPYITGEVEISTFITGLHDVLFVVNKRKKN